MSHFEDLVRHTVERNNFGGVQVLDYVEIKDTDFEGVTDEIKAGLKELQDSDLNIKVLEVVKGTPEEGRNEPKFFSAVIGQEIASGIFPKKFTVPVKNLSVKSYNVPNSIPDSWKAEMNHDNKGEPESAKEVGGTTEVKRTEPKNDIKHL